jgi:cell division protein FtsA
LTGGSTLLPGMIEMAEEVLGMPARLGLPMHVSGLTDVIASPIYATGVGLVLYGIKRQDKNFFRIRENNMLGKVKGRMADWLSEFF